MSSDSTPNDKRNEEFLVRLADAKQDADGTLGGPLPEATDDEWRLGKVVVFKEVLCLNMGDFLPDDVALVERAAADRMESMGVVRFETEDERKAAIATGEPRGPATGPKKSKSRAAAKALEDAKDGDPDGE